MTKYSAYPDTAVEAKPGLKQVTGAKAARTGVMSVKISWSYVSYRTGYEIWRCDTEDGEYTKVGATAGTYFYNYWVVPGETYYYKVKAYRISGGVTYYGDFSNVVSATA